MVYNIKNIERRDSMAFQPKNTPQMQGDDPRQALARADRRKRRLQILAPIFSFVLVGAAAAALVLSLQAQKNPKPAPQATEPPVVEHTPHDLTVVHLAAAGDLNVTERVVGLGGDYTDTFLDVAPILSQADITALNFEGGLYGEPYGEDASAPATMAQALKNAGVDIVQLANSYTIYQGTAGLASTVNGMTEAGLTPIGAWANTAAAKTAGGYTLCEVKGIKIAFVAFTKGMDGMALPKGSEGCVNLLYTDYASAYQKINTEGITAVLNAVAQEAPDITVAMLHWGSEYNDTISTSQTKIVELLQENGVDAIIGSHSHFVQQMTFDPATGHFVAYSLGDFLGNADRAGTEYSVILDLEITKNNTTGHTQITNFSYTPIYTVTDGNAPRVMRIDTTMKAYEGGYIARVSSATYDSMKYAWNRIRARIVGE